MLKYYSIVVHCAKLWKFVECIKKFLSLFLGSFMAKRKIYYWAVAILMVLFLVCSFLNLQISNGSKLDFKAVESHVDKLTGINRANTQDSSLRNDGVVDYITSALREIGIEEQTYNDRDVEDGYPGVSYVDSKPTFLVQEATINADTAEAIAKDSGVHYSGAEIKNVVVAFPGTQSGADAVTFNVSYDAPLYLDGAMTANADVAVMLETIKNFKSASHKNDVVFLFGQNNVADLGLHAFIKQFQGFGGVAGNTTVTVGLRGVGAKGSLALVDSSANNSAVVSRVGLSGSASTSFNSQFLKNVPNFNQINGLGIPFVTFANVGDLAFVSSPSDNNLVKSTVEAKAGLLQRTLDKLSNGDIAKSTFEANSDAAIFSFFGINIAISSVFYIVLAVLILLGAIAIASWGIIKKSFNIANLIKAAVLQIIALGLTILVGLGIYYLIGYFLMVGYNVIPLHLLSGFVFYNAGILIAFLLVGLLASNAFYGPLKKWFKTKAIDITRANVLLLSLFAAIVGFVVPTLAYPLLWLSLLQLVVMALNIQFKDKFKEKYGRDIERMFFYGIPVILTLPLIIPAMIAIAQVAALPLYSLLSGLGVMVFGFVLPFLSFLKPVLDKGLEKLPSYYVTEVFTTEQEVEHQTKKGRMVVERVQQKTKSPRKIKYHSAFGTILVFVVASVLMFVSARPATAFGISVDAGNYNSIYKNSIVLSWTQGGGEDTGNNLQWEIKDNAAFRVFDSAKNEFGYKIADGFEYNSSANAFTKPETNTELFGSTPTIASQGSGVYDFKPAAPNTSQIDLVAKGASNTTRFEIKIGDQVKFEVLNSERKDEVAISLPYAFGNLASGATFSVVAYSQSSGDGQSISWDYHEYSYNQNDLMSFSIWSSLQDYFGEDGNNMLRGGVVYNIVQA